MRTRSPLFLVAAALCAGFSILSAGSALANTCAAPRPVNESLTAKSGLLGIFVYYPSAPKVDALKEAKSLVAKHAPEFKWHDSLPKDSASAPMPWVAGKPFDSNVNPPPVDFLDFKGRGLSTEEKNAVARSAKGFLLTFHLPARDFSKSFVKANGIVLEFARNTGGYVHDQETREVFSVEAWRSTRTTESADLVTVSKHITIHGYRNGDYLRAVTLGMMKFGLPELAVSEFRSDEGSGVQRLINVLAQRMAEGPLEVKAGRVELRVGDLRASPFRKSIEDGIQAGGKSKAALCLNDKKPEPGDVENRLLELNFDLSGGGDKHAHRNAFLFELFGARPSDVSLAKSTDAELAAASRKARTEMGRLREEFNKGLPAGNRLSVKAPFRAPDGSTEFMWVEVARWDSSGIRGLLSSTPRNVKNLRAGQEVTVPESDFYDYMRVHADGAVTGNETTKILMRRQGK